MTYRKLKLILAAVGGLFLTTQSATADKFSCRTTPTSYLGVNGVGWVIVGVEAADRLQVCNLNSSVGSVSAENCKAWYSAFLTWRTINKRGWLYFDGAQNGGATSCANFAAWDTRIPYHMEASQD